MKYVKLSIQEPVAVVTIDRPDCLNALNSQVFREISATLQEVEANDQVRVVILTGAGDKAFAAGADIAQMVHENGKQGKELALLTHQAGDLLENIRQVTIAAVNGYALGGGCELALCCDIIIASKKAKFGLPEAKLGIIPTYMGTQRLPRAIGTLKAKELMFTARFVDGEEAASIGLANLCVEPEELLPKAEEMMTTILSRGPLSIRYMKQAVNRGFDMPFADACEYERALGGLCLASDDCAEGVAAFVEKRDPVFKNQ